MAYIWHKVATMGHFYSITVEGNMLYNMMNDEGIIIKLRYKNISPFITIVRVWSWL